MKKNHVYSLTVALALSLVPVIGCAPTGGEGEGEGDGGVTEGEGEDIDTAAFNGVLSFRTSGGLSAIGRVRDLGANEILARLDPTGAPAAEFVFSMQLDASATKLVYTWQRDDLTVLGAKGSEAVLRDLESGDETPIPTTVDGQPGVVRHAFLPQVSAGGDVIVFKELLHEVEGDTEDIFGIGLFDGTGVRTVVSDQQINSLRITADGETAFYVTEDGRQLFRLSLPNGAPEEVDLTGHADCDSILLSQGGLDWDVSDDGAVLAYNCGLADSDERGAFLLEGGSSSRIGTLASTLYVDLSGDGSTVAVTAVEGAGQGLYLADTNGGAPALVQTDLTIGVADPTLSDDGSQIAYLGNSEEHLFGALFVAQADGSSPTLVISHDLDETFNWVSAGALSFRQP